MWQALNTANWDIQDHDQRQGPLVQFGAAFSVPAGERCRVGNEVPYQPWALEKKKENAAQWLKLDPEVKCYLPGIPRATYMPYPFQIVQTPNHVVFAYEYANASRIVDMTCQGRSAHRQLDGVWLAAVGWRNAGDRSQQVSTIRRGSTAREIFTARRCAWSNVTRRSVQTRCGTNVTIEDPESFYPSLADEDDSLSSPRRSSTFAGIQLCRVCRRDSLWASSQVDRQLEMSSWTRHGEGR